MVADLLSRFEEDRYSKGYSRNTIDRVVKNTTLFLRDSSIVYLRDMTTDTIIHWGTAQLREGKKTSTIYAYYNSIRSFVCFLDELKIHHNLDKTRIKCRPFYERMVCLTPQAVRKIASSCDYDTSLLVRLMYTTGMRISEVISITPNMVVGIEIIITGKGRKKRSVFVTQSIANELKILTDGNKRYFAIDRSTAYYRIKHAMIHAGYPNAYPHSLRHTFATTLIKNGATLSHVQRLMGHANVSTTQRYEHLVTDDIKKAHAKYLVSI